MAKKRNGGASDERVKSPYACWFGQCNESERSACLQCNDTGKQLCAEAEYDRRKGPRWGGPVDKRDNTSFVHEAVRWNLGPRYAGLFQTYVVVVSLTYDTTNLVNQGRLNLDDLARVRGLKYRSFLKDHIDRLSCLDLIRKYRQAPLRRKKREQRDPGETVYVLPLPPWVYTNIEFINAVRNARDEAELKAAYAQLEKCQRTIVGWMLKRLRRKRKRTETWPVKPLGRAKAK